jgi:conjugative transfer pilus assembly protein TraH
MNIRTKISPLLVGMALAMTVSNSAQAGLSDMQEFFNDVGVYGNASGASSFQGQTRNYLTGGSLQVRIPDKNYQLATMDAPRLSSSACGGIDAFAGSFSFLNSDQLVGMLQNIGNNAAGAVFQLALDSVSPKLGAVIKYFQDMANKVNALNVNSCEAAKGIVTATKDGALQSGFMKGMKEMGSQVTGLADDWSGVQEAFATQPETVKATADVIETSGLSDEQKKWIKPGNVLWRALGEVTNGGTGIDDDEKKLIQAMVGTVIIKHTTTTPIALEATSYEPLMIDPLSAFMGPDADSEVAISVYDCNDMAKCDTIGNGQSIIYINTLRKIIHDKMKATQEKIMNRTGGITADDYEVVNMSFLPVWTMMEAEYRTDGLLGILDNSEEVIALSYTKALLLRTLKTVRFALTTFNKNKNPGIALEINALKGRILDLNKDVRRSMSDSMARYSAFNTARTSLGQQVTRIKERTAKQLSIINSRTR